MKLLFDENRSPKLPDLLASLFPHSRHVRDCGLKGFSDEEVWNHARANGFILVSKDKDFYARMLFHGHPPKLIWIRIGNCTRDQILQLLIKHEREINAFEAALLESILVLAPS